MNGFLGIGGYSWIEGVGFFSAGFYELYVVHFGASVILKGRRMEQTRQVSENVSRFFVA